MQRSPATSVLIAGSLLGVPATAQQWNEQDDAPSSPTSEAQVVAGSGPLESISGATSTGGDDFVDAYVIDVINAQSFYATTSSAWDEDAAAAWNTRLFLFELDGLPLLANDDAPGDVGTQSYLSDPALFEGVIDPTALPLTNGPHVLVITGFANDPLDTDGLALFSLSADADALFGPDSNAGPFDQWENLHGLTMSGSYTIALQGAAFIESSCPADLDGSGVVDVSDLLQLLGAWGPCTGCVEDLDGSGSVDVSDLLTLLATWGVCS
jgi:hypothetical protein